MKLLVLVISSAPLIVGFGAPTDNHRDMTGWYRYKICKDSTTMFEGEFCTGCGDGISCAPAIEDPTSCGSWREERAGVCAQPKVWMPGTSSSYIDCTHPDGKPRIYGYADATCSGEAIRIDHKQYCWFEGGNEEANNWVTGIEYPHGLPYYDCPV